MRRSGIDVIGEVPWGSHFCQFYDTEQDLIETLVPYFREGLAANEFCMWVTAAPLGVEEAKAALRAAVPDLDRHIEKGQIEILDYRQWYIRSGKFSADEVLQAWVEKLSAAQAKGYEGLRLSGNTLWLEPSDWADFTRYEEAVNNVIGRYRMLALCTYSLQKCGAMEIIDVVANHQFALIKRRGNWEIIESFRHKRMEQALRDQETFSRKVIESSLDGTYIYDCRKNQIVFTNPEYDRITGYTQKDLSAMSREDLFSCFEPADRPRHEEHLNRVCSAADGEAVEIEYKFRRADGKWIWCLSRHTVFERDENGQVLKFIGSLLDITTRKQADIEIGRLASFPVLNPQPVIEVDMDGRLFFANPSAQRQFPDLQELGLDHPWLAGWKSLEDTGLRTGANIPAREVEVGERWFHQTMYFVPETRRLRIYGIDITDRKRAEEVLRHRTEDLQRLSKTLEKRVKDRTAKLGQANEILESVFSNIHFLIAYMDKDFNFIRVNRAYAEADGRLPEFYCGKNHFALFPNRENEEIFRRVVETGEHYFVDEKPFVFSEHPERGITYWDWHLHPVREPDGRVNGLVLSLIDVTRRKLAERERLRLVAAVEQAQEGVAITDLGGLISYVNPAFEKTSGRTRPDLLGACYYDFLEGEETEGRLKNKIKEIVRTGESWSGRLSRKKDSGQSREVEVSFSPIRDESGRVINYLAMERDVTEEVRLQHHLRQIQKMEALGTLAGGIAHDFNNILNPIFINTELVLLDAPLDERLRYDLETVLRAAERGRDLVRQIISFSRQKEKERRAVKVAPIIREAIKLLSASLPAGVEIREKFGSREGFILADPAEIFQVIMNLGTNSVYSMRERGGVLEVSLGEIEVDEEIIKRHPDLKPGPHIRLIVGDTGTGMTPEVMDRAFDPFFTTKKPGEGTGMGLAMVHGIVKDLKGAITVYSQAGRGSTFNVFFPRAEMEGAASDVSAAALAGGKERILLVDDEEAQVQSLQNMLERLGYGVEARTSSAEALALFRENPRKFDLVITDQNMPQMTGSGLSKELLRLHPGLPIILCTGFSEMVDANGAKSMGVRGFLMKPFSIKEMAETIRRALEEKIPGTADAKPLRRAKVRRKRAPSRG